MIEQPPISINTHSDSDTPPTTMNIPFIILTPYHPPTPILCLSMDKAVGHQCTLATILFHRSPHLTADPSFIKLPKVQLSLRYFRIWFICSKRSFLVLTCRTFSTRRANSSILASCSAVNSAGGSGSGSGSGGEDGTPRRGSPLLLRLKELLYKPCTTWS